MNILEVSMRLLLAVIIGGLIGYERELNNRAAGFRTHILVCVGAAVTALIQVYAFEQVKITILDNPSLQGVVSADMLRLSAQVISGVGFLGAGTIIYEKGSVKGLTTAASLWVVSIIGLATGYGYYTLSIASFVCVFIVVVVLKNFEHKFIGKTRREKLEIVFDKKLQPILEVDKLLKEMGIRIKSIEYSTEEEENNECIYTLFIPVRFTVEEVIDRLMGIEHIINVKHTS
ncbi:MAG: MgtC/SapB family protein [Clostridiales bacterium]|uniref:MgtC/SapB family protein n=1 Tax=Clostridium sp. N3C TaxID=1776758 RepID=UPI00092DEC09|nr:MgtC/SapB family protein [Clostridium sp. N3C]NLZ47476.1 MgtC/SapB family protein [Clostridiales bacterium]SCN21859.1 putative Mg(2+) transport ATPase [Clostridium sp. N3C]